MNIKDLSSERGPGDPSGHPNVLWHAAEVKMWGDKSTRPNRRKQWHCMAADLRSVVEEAQEYRKFIEELVAHTPEPFLIEMLAKYEKNQPT